MTKTVDITFVCEFLNSHDDYAIICHSSPDGDTVGSAYALAHMLKNCGKKAAVFCADEIPAKFSFITESYKSNLENYKTVVSVDVADELLFGEKLREFQSKTVLSIDHHASNRQFSQYLLCDSTAAATSEIIYDIIKQNGSEFTPAMLSAIYTGIVTDTGCFKFSNTTAKTHLIAAKLIDMGVDYAEINRLMFDTKSRERVQIEGEVMNNMQFHCDGKVAFIEITRDMLLSSGCSENDLDGINALSRTIEGVIVGITAREKADGNFKISLRTNEPINAAEICEKFGGGGHIRAAGCEFSKDDKDFRKKLLNEVKKALEEY